MSFKDIPLGTTDDSTLGGKGTFAKEQIKKGTIITSLSGEPATTEEIIDRINNNDLNIDDPLQIGEGEYLLLDEPSRLINHSCDPNAGVRGKSELFAIKDIGPGEEITYDYSTVVGTDVPKEVWEMKCLCDSPICRKTISNVLSIPNDQLENYRKLGALPDFVLRQLSVLTN